MNHQVEQLVNGDSSAENSKYSGTFKICDHVELNDEHIGAQVYRRGLIEHFAGFRLEKGKDLFTCTILDGQ